MIIWFTGIITIAGFSTVVSFLDIIQENKIMIEGNLIFVLLVAVIMILFGIFIVRYGLKLSKKEEKYMIGFLQQILNAKEID